MIDIKESNPAQSMNWFKQKINNLAAPRLLSDVRPKNINYVEDQVHLFSGMNINMIGSMFMYVYDPKHKATLPMYDTFPLIILFKMLNDGFVGLNLHYINPLQRLNILNMLIKNTEREKNPDARIILNYSALSALQLSPLKLCYKHYLSSHVRSRFLFIEPKDWNKACVMPSENFVYKS